MRLTPFLWYDNDLEQALELYGQIFPELEVTSRSTNDGSGSEPEGSLSMAGFTLLGQEFLALNGGPSYHFTEAYSMYVQVEDQAEVDRLWDGLTAHGGQEGRCGWCKDPFGMSWQIVPRRLEELLSDPDPARSAHATLAMLKMNKIVIADLEKAADED